VDENYAQTEEGDDPHRIFKISPSQLMLAKQNANAVYPNVTPDLPKIGHTWLSCSH
jgi:hypothetical protein